MSNVNLTRDKQLASDIESAQRLVRTHRNALNTWAEKAEQEDALGHAGLYREAAARLQEAWDSLDAAWEVVANGDPEEYA